MRIIKLSDSQIGNYIVIAFFCISLTPYLSAYLPNAILQLILYISICGLMLAYTQRTSLIHLKGRIDDQLFWVLLAVYIPMLGIRLYVDFIIIGREFFVFGSSFTILFVYMMQIVIPALFFRFYDFKINSRRIGYILAEILCVCMILSINKILNGDVEISDDGRFDNGYGIFAIEFGHYAISLVLCSIVLLRSTKRFGVRLLLILSILIGFFASILAGSRGPYMALVICIGILFIGKNRRKGRILKYVLIGITLLPLCLYCLSVLSDVFADLGFRSFERIYESFFGGESLANQTSGRDILYKEAMDYFSMSPVWGYSYLIPGKIYVHNILIEQFMALGIVGGCVFLVINILALRKAWDIIKNNPDFSLIPILYIQYLIFGCFSSTIINLPQYWLFLLLTMNHQVKDTSNVESILYRRKIYVKENYKGAV